MSGARGGSRGRPGLDGLLTELLAALMKAGIVTLRAVHRTARGEDYLVDGGYAEVMLPSTA